MLKALCERGAKVRAMVRNPAQADALRQEGAVEVVTADLERPETYPAALTGCSAVLHICPPMHPNENGIAKSLIRAMTQTGVERLVYYSVMHPLRRAVRHHAYKLDGEEAVVESRLRYTIVQPIRYMQHLDKVWSSVCNRSVHNMPFNVDVRFSVVDLADLAEACARILTEPGHEYATYELAGPEPLNQREMAAILSRVTGHPIEAQAQPLVDWAEAARAKGLSEDKIANAIAMNEHYDAHGFLGNGNVLRWILGRPLTTYAEYAARRWAQEKRA
jgi:uncharacterized protein YbjT (DUF2867 family)